MSKGGSTTSSTEIPAWLENAAIENINKGRDVSEIGYTPYYGPEVAAFSPMQQQSMQSTGSAASAFGLAPQGFDGRSGIPRPQSFSGGIQGYSSAPMFQESVNQLQANRPAQYQAMADMFIDPFTGAPSSGNYTPTTAQVLQSNYAQRGDAGSVVSGINNAPDYTPAANAGAFDYNNDMFTQSDTGAYYPVQEQAQLKDIMGGSVYGLMGDALGGDSNPVGGALSAYADMSPMSDFVNQVQYGMNEGSMNQYEAMSKSNPNWINMSEVDRVNAAREAYKAGTPLPSAPAPVNVEPAPYQGGGNNNKPAPATGGGGWSQPSAGSGGSYGGGGDSYDPSGRW
jgi:hypothetical protein